MNAVTAHFGTILFPSSTSLGLYLWDCRLMILTTGSWDQSEAGILIVLRWSGLRVAKIQILSLLWSPPTAAADSLQNATPKSLLNSSVKILLRPLVNRNAEFSKSTWSMDGHSSNSLKICKTRPERLPSIPCCFAFLLAQEQSWHGNPAVSTEGMTLKDEEVSNEISLQMGAVSISLLCILQSNTLRASLFTWLSCKYLSTHRQNHQPH